MKQREEKIPAAGKARLSEALESLVHLYEAKGNQPEAAAWRSKLEAAKADPDKTDGATQENPKP